MYADRIGVGLVDGRKDRFEESVYLLNEEFTVVGRRLASDPDARAPRIGDRFFDRFKASPMERAALRRMMASVSSDAFLMRAGGRPVLMLTGFFSRTRLLAAVVPEGEIRASLEAPGAFADVLEVWHVQLSAKARVSGDTLDEDRYALLFEWISRVHLPLFPEGNQGGRLDAEIRAIAARLACLSHLCGCRMEYDLSGFRYVPLHIDDLDLLIGTALAVFLMAHRVDRERSVLVRGERLFGDGPVLNVLLCCELPLSELSEIEVLRREVAARGGLFEVYQYESGAYSLHLQFSICNQELSAQDIKVKRPFEVGGEVVRAYSVTDEEITAVQNEINAQKQ